MRAVDFQRKGSARYHSLCGLSHVEKDLKIEATAKKKTLALWSGIAILLLPLVSCSCPPTPSVSSISPTSAAAGGSGFVLTVNGGSFSSNSVVVWNGTALGTAFVSGNQLMATVNASNVATPDTALVYVYNPAGSTVGVGTAITTTNSNGCGSPGSNSVSFTVSP